MDLKKLKETDSPLVGRKTITFRAEYTGERTPSNEQMEKAVASELKVQPELVEVDRIMQDFGSASAMIEVNIYRDIQSMQKFRVVAVQKAAPKPKEDKEK